MWYLSLNGTGLSVKYFYLVMLISRNIFHVPTCTCLFWIIFISSPWRAADVQVCVWSSVEHDPGTGITDSSRKAITLCIVRPSNHIVRTDRNCWTCVIVDVRAA